MAYEQTFRVMQMALEKVSDSLVETNKSLHSMNETLHEVKKDVAVLKDQDWSAKYGELSGRIADLETSKHKETGARDVADWIVSKVMPWLVTVFATVATIWFASKSQGVQK